VHLAVAMLGEVMNRKPEPGLVKGGARPDIAGEIVIEDVRFAYAPGDPRPLTAWACASPRARSWAWSAKAVRARPP
jgi:ABC-type bacteriocin/lantibiotic exporter with double-glycine peptidase domain